MAETTDTVDLAIYRKLAGSGPCTFDELVRRLSTYSWAQVFSAVDRLSREGTVSVSRTRGVDYVISNRAGSFHSRIFARPRASNGTISGNQIRRRRVNHEVA
ncbi:MAG TPA: hypothetical protein VLE46_16035 [Nitrospira sp.]|nr:hypothetical protein [Nitrospira sp.]